MGRSLSRCRASPTAYPEEDPMPASLEGRRFTKRDATTFHLVSAAYITAMVALGPSSNPTKKSSEPMASLPLSISTMFLASMEARKIAVGRPSNWRNLLMAGGMRRSLLSPIQPCCNDDQNQNQYRRKYMPTAHRGSPLDPPREISIPPAIEIRSIAPEAMIRLLPNVKSR